MERLSNVGQNWIKSQLGMQLAASFHKTLLAMETTMARPHVVENCAPILLSRVYGTKERGDIHKNIGNFITKSLKVIQYTLVNITQFQIIG